MGVSVMVYCGLVSRKFASGDKKDHPVRHAANTPPEDGNWWYGLLWIWLAVSFASGDLKGHQSVFWQSLLGELVYEYV